MRASPVDGCTASTPACAAPRYAPSELANTVRTGRALRIRRIAKPIAPKHHQMAANARCRRRKGKATAAATIAYTPNQYNIELALRFPRPTNHAGQGARLLPM